MHSPLFTSVNFQSPPTIYGVMRMHGTFSVAEVDDDRRREAMAAMDAAFEAGCRHFDRAEIYAGVVRVLA